MSFLKTERERRRSLNAMLGGQPLDDSDNVDARPPEFSDEALALAFADRHRNELRYVAAWGRWLAWSGHKWAQDDTLAVFDRVRALCREHAARCNKLKAGQHIASAKTVAAVERLSRSDRSLAATVDQWDSDHWLLNTPERAVDLKSGDYLPSQPYQYATKSTAVSPGGTISTWLTFLDRATAGNTDLQSFLQRMAGYCLTGSTREHALFFLYGTGANGKSVFVNTLSGIVADYGVTAGMETFVASNSDRHPTDLASLRGARLVTATETEEGRHWAEARIKALTGGDKIAARHMRQDFFEFCPIFKLLVCGNHKPSLRNVDEAIRRRLHLIPFTVTIPPAERDPSLAERLREEWPGILAWMIEGALQWQEIGLQPPPVVRDATAEYLEAEDALAIWLAECTITDPTCYATSADLFRSWKSWAERARESIGTQKGFSQTLINRGFIQRRQPGTGRMGFDGLLIKQEDTSDAYWNR